MPSSSLSFPSPRAILRLNGRFGPPRAENPPGTLGATQAAGSVHLSRTKACATHGDELAQPQFCHEQPQWHWHTAVQGARLWFRITFLLLLASIPQACARKDPAVESLIGSEPQRLSFGPPPQVLHAFIEKMKLCWFSGANPALAGYRYEAGESAPGEDDSSGEGYPNVRVYSESASSPVFEIQFHRYNDNTLIVTRNFSLPSDVSTKVKRDIQLWALTGTDCAS